MRPDVASLDVCHLTTTGRVTGRPHRIEIWFVLADETAVRDGRGPGSKRLGPQPDGLARRSSSSSVAASDRRRARVVARAGATRTPPLGGSCSRSTLLAAGETFARGVGRRWSLRWTGRPRSATPRSSDRRCGSAERDAVVRRDLRETVQRRPVGEQRRNIPREPVVREHRSTPGSAEPRPEASRTECATPFGSSWTVPDPPPVHSSSPMRNSAYPLTTIWASSQGWRCIGGPSRSVLE